MFVLKRKLCLWIILFSLSVQSLTLPEAESLALSHSSRIKQAIFNGQSYQALAHVNAEYEDPKLNFGLINLPADNFSISRNPTTQLRFGLKQSLPRGSELDYKKAHFNNMANQMQFQSNDEWLKVLKNTRLSYLSLFHGIQKERILILSRNQFINLLSLSEQNYANGMNTQQSIINAQLQLANVDDKILKTRNNIQQSRSRLSYWIGDNYQSDIPSNFPIIKLKNNYHRDVFTLEKLQNHPAFQKATATINALEDKLAIDQEKSKSAWTIGLEYRKRFGNNDDLSGRSDLLAFTASIDMPQFNKRKLNNILLSAEVQIQAAEQSRNDIRKQFVSEFQSVNAQHAFLEKRLMLYENTIFQTTIENNKAAISAYQNGKSDFSVLIEAENAELNAKLEILSIKVQLLKEKSKLMYLLNVDRISQGRSK
jgi:outer membrane protein TolC